MAKDKRIGGRSIRSRFLVLASVVFSVPAANADPDKDEARGRYGDRDDRYRGGYYTRYDEHGPGEYKDEYWADGCKVERKWERGGEYKEQRKCEHGAAPWHHGKHEGKEVFWDGGCRVERNWTERGVEEVRTCGAR